MSLLFYLLKNLNGSKTERKPISYKYLIDTKIGALKE
jgi:hypothetical protein